MPKVWSIFLNGLLECLFSVKSYSLKLRLYLMVLGSVLVLSSTEVIAQSCPTFETKEIINSTEGLANGQAKFIIKGTKFYNEQNFEIRQKEHGVTGPLGFDIELKLVGNELTVSKLKRSEELFLKEYVIRFSDKSCDNAKIVEVDTFKIN